MFMKSYVGRDYGMVVSTDDVSDIEGRISTPSVLNHYYVHPTAWKWTSYRYSGPQKEVDSNGWGGVIDFPNFVAYEVNR
jgi:hypothetical protein